MKYLIKMNPPTKIITNRIQIKLKKESIKSFIIFPYFHIKIDTKKKRADLLMADARINKWIGTVNAPDDMVIILKGIGVKPAVNIIINPIYNHY